MIHSNTTGLIIQSSCIGIQFRAIFYNYGTYIIIRRNINSAIFKFNLIKCKLGIKVKIRIKD